MRKRFFAFLLAALAAFSFMCSSAPEAEAVAPAALVEAALVSYVASTGYKLWVDNGTGSDLLSIMSDLYSDWLFSLSGGALTLEQIGNQDLVYADNSGNIIITQTAADIFQSFAEWIKTNYSVVPGDPSVTVSQGGTIANIPAGSTSGSYDITSLVDPLACFEYLLSNANPNINWTTHRSVITDFINDHSGSLFYITCTTSSSFTGWSPASITALPYVTPFVANHNYTGSDFLQFYGSTSNGVISFTSYRVQTNKTGYANYGMNIGANNAYCLCVNGTITHSVGLSVQLAQDIIDKATDLTQDYVLVFDVGATDGATATDIADAVVAGYDATTGTIPVTDTIAAADVIDTPVQPYPDIDSLGLPQLGAALVDRFPFCIPWDFVDTVRLLSADPQPINITVDLIPQRIKTSVGISSNTSFNIDLSGEQYAKIGVFCRWGSLITFCFGLFLLTKRLVWTA